MKTVSFVKDVPQIRRGLPLAGTLCEVCGAPQEESRLEGMYENPLSLDALFVRHPAATFFIEVEGSHEQVAVSENTFLGIHRGDVLTIDRALTPTLGRLVLAVCDGSFTLCRYTEHEGQQFLVCGDDAATAREITENGEVCIWGVVSALSRRL